MHRYYLGSLQTPWYRSLLCERYDIPSAPPSREQSGQFPRMSRLMSSLGAWSKLSFDTGYGEYFGLSTDIEACVYLMLANDLIHTVRSFLSCIVHALSHVCRNEGGESTRVQETFVSINLVTCADSTRMSIDCWRCFRHAYALPTCTFHTSRDCHVTSKCTRLVWQPRTAQLRFKTRILVEIISVYPF